MEGRGGECSMRRGDGDPAADIGIVVLITGVGELLTSADSVDIMNREGTEPVISVVVTVGTKDISTREIDRSC